MLLGDVQLSRRTEVSIVPLMCNMFLSSSEDIDASESEEESEEKDEKDEAEQKAEIDPCIEYIPYIRPAVPFAICQPRLHAIDFLSETRHEPGLTSLELFAKI